LRRDARWLLLGWGFDFDVDEPASELSVEQKQIVEIARALALGARFLILDEPTASLESNAIERLFERIRRVRTSGVAILYISHHLEEIYEICDRATVLRDGKRILTAAVTELEHDRLVAAMAAGTSPAGSTRGAYRRRPSRACRASPSAGSRRRRRSARSRT
jgi:simple sugar transport system ATP-binding protein